ncbi:hypothetical protein ACJX0J_033310 [Zea mays]
MRRRKGCGDRGCEMADSPTTTRKERARDLQKPPDPQRRRLEDLYGADGLIRRLRRNQRIKMWNSDFQMKSVTKNFLIFHHLFHSYLLCKLFLISLCVSVLTFRKCFFKLSLVFSQPLICFCVLCSALLATIFIRICSITTVLDREDAYLAQAVFKHMQLDDNEVVLGGGQDAMNVIYFPVNKVPIHHHAVVCLSVFICIFPHDHETQAIFMCNRYFDNYAHVITKEQICE